MITTDVNQMPEYFRKPEFTGNSMMCKKLTMLPIECIVRGYITGSGWASYQKDGTVCGIKLPAGLVNSSKIPETIFTPSTKAELGEHDENISFEEMARLVGDEAAADLRDLTLKIYTKAADHAASHGIIIADTKLEFGLYDGRIILADEVLTPDSSRFWPADTYQVGAEQPSFDKQYVRNWLKANWDRTGNPPHMPEDVIAQTTEKYITAYEMITGMPFARR
jgi:phosphoribosylaminoimidazole-succinocarboxamide synthase